MSILNKALEVGIGIAATAALANPLQAAQAQSIPPKEDLFYNPNPTPQTAVEPEGIGTEQDLFFNPDVNKPPQDQAGVATIYVYNGQNDSYPPRYHCLTDPKGMQAIRNVLGKDAPGGDPNLDGSIRVYMSSEEMKALQQQGAVFLRIDQDNTKTTEPYPIPDDNKHSQADWTIVRQSFLGNQGK